MSAAADQSNFPTMIIPRGTEIRVNNHGQLSIKTPGNLVIQNSGVYSELESTNGSIRIEENVTVEAVSVRAAQACFIQGTLTAWKVHAKRISLEDRAKAFIMLGRCARRSGSAFAPSRSSSRAAAVSSATSRTRRSSS